jgi:aryl-alcohol dehydrogenase-like predicted oxidoreductase
MAMKYRTLPGTDLQLSAVGFGCWAIGGRWWGDDVRDADSKAAVQAALDHGINWFDTAPLYGYGHADEILVSALGARRHDVIIATKVGVRWDNDGEHAESDLSPEHIVADAEASLRRLGLDVIPLLQVHWPCQRETPLEATLAALVRLREQGKIRHFGLCNYDAETFARAVERAPVASLQTPYSMVRREFDRELREVVAPEDSEGARRQRVGVLAYEPLARGLLTGKFKVLPSFPASDLRARDDRFREPSFSRIRPLVRALELVGQKLDVSPAALALAWVCTRPGISVAIAGAKRPEQVAQNVRAIELLGRSQIWRALAPHVDRCRP